MSRITLNSGQVFEIRPVTGVLHVYEVRALQDGRRRVGFIQMSPLCLIPNRSDTASSLLLLEEIYGRATADGVIPLRS